MYFFPKTTFFYKVSRFDYPSLTIVNDDHLLTISNIIVNKFFFKNDRSRAKTIGWYLSYDEILEGEDGEDAVDCPDELNFRFEVPDEVESIELV